VEKPSRVPGGKKRENNNLKRKTVIGNLTRLLTLTFYIKVTAQCLIFRTYYMYIYKTVTSQQMSFAGSLLCLDTDSQADP